MSSQQTLEEVTNREYQYGFVTDIDAETVPPGLDESVVGGSRTKKGAAVALGLAFEGVSPMA